MAVISEHSLRSICNGRGYVLEKLIGKGGMGQVWLARDPRGCEVAVKVPVGTPEAVKRLLFEIDLLRRLQHEHVVGYVDSFEASGLPILVMEYAGGVNLELKAMGRRLNESEALARTVQLLLGLDYLHSMGVIHRDVKPKNVIVGDNRTYLKLVDLGTATYFHRAGVPECVISPGGYTPPEQHRYMASPQGDIWSVGATLYFMLTGQHPALDMPGYPDAQCSPPDPRKYNKDVSDSTVEIIRRAMRWNPAERFSSPMEMIMAIEGVTQKRELDVPVLEVLGRSVPVETASLVFGRGDNMPESVRVVKEGDITYVYINDPYRWVSRKHFEIFRDGSKWYIRDLGSLNRTAVRSGEVVRELWVGHGKPSPPIELPRGSIIYVAYGSSLRNQAFIVLVFK